MLENREKKRIEVSVNVTQEPFFLIWNVSTHSYPPSPPFPSSPSLSSPPSPPVFRPTHQLHRTVSYRKMKRQLEIPLRPSLPDGLQLIAARHSRPMTNACCLRDVIQARPRSTSNLNFTFSLLNLFPLCKHNQLNIFARLIEFSSDTAERLERHAQREVLDVDLEPEVIQISGKN